jgi:DNA-directed RNA polymerase specialized sigma24 family protein
MEASKPRREEDLALARRVQDGEREAFDSFYEQAFPKVYAFAMRRCVGIEEAEALTGEVLETAIATIASYRGDAPLLAWLLAISRKAALRKRCAQDRGRPCGFGIGSASIPRGDGRHC